MHLFTKSAFGMVFLIVTKDGANIPLKAGEMDESVSHGRWKEREQEILF